LRKELGKHDSLTPRQAVEQFLKDPRFKDYAEKYSSTNEDGVVLLVRMLSANVSRFASELDTHVKRLVDGDHLVYCFLESEFSADVAIKNKPEAAYKKLADTFWILDDRTSGPNFRGGRQSFYARPLF
jgi:hypothetical protein